MKNWLLDVYCSKNMKKEGLLGHAIAEECELNNFHFKEVLFLIFFRGGKRGGKTSVRGAIAPPPPCPLLATPLRTILPNPNITAPPPPGYRPLWPIIPIL